MKFPLKFKLPQNTNFILLWGLLVFFSFCIVWSLWARVKEGAKGLEGFSEGAQGKMSSDDVQKINDLQKQIEDIKNKYSGDASGNSSSPSSSSSESSGSSSSGSYSKSSSSAPASPSSTSS